MNRCFLATLLLPAILSSALSADVESLVQGIRTQYNATESARLTKRTIKLDGGPVSAELVKFFDADGILVKMSLSTVGDHGSGTDYYYVNRGILYFVFQEEGSWSFDPTGPEGTTIDKSTERRVYYSGNQVIRHLLKVAGSRNPDAVAGLLKKAENREARDVEMEARFLSDAQRLLLVESEKELEGFLYAE